MLTLSFINCLVFWIALILYSIDYKKSKNREALLSMYLWVLHVTIYFSVLAILRMIFDYVGPSRTMTLWANILFVQAAISIAGMSLVRYRCKRFLDLYISENKIDELLD